MRRFQFYRPYNGPVYFFPGHYIIRLHAWESVGQVIHPLFLFTADQRVEKGTMPTSKRPPIDGGKNSLAARKKYNQLQESEQRQRNRVELLVLVGKQPMPAVSVAPGKPSSTSERYNARVASAEKALSSTSTDLTALHVLTNKIVIWDGYIYVSFG